jgi:hypothetical protein
MVTMYLGMTDAPSQSRNRGRMQGRSWKRGVETSDLRVKTSSVQGPGLTAADLEKQSVASLNLWQKQTDRLFK